MSPASSVTTSSTLKNWVGMYTLENLSGSNVPVRTCSWVEGFRCYPGSCRDAYYRYYDSDGKTKCKCSTGFTGTDCKTDFNIYSPKNSCDNVFHYDFVHVRAIGFKEAGWNVKNIARRFNVERATIYRLWQRFQVTGTVRDKPRSVFCLVMRCVKLLWQVGVQARDLFHSKLSVTGCTPPGLSHVFLRRNKAHRKGTYMRGYHFAMPVGTEHIGGLCCTMTSRVFNFGMLTEASVCGAGVFIVTRIVP
ncbi:hypothetical protein MAR_020265 [Mya arenaria]|uniref:EGF-like domain-containing protein n=1 Tax=Mya arenaria TaxID=6604 RepID=A0ABY7E7J3_MYAAR|nr:hypothetical protein MAR_020265 [Mya arenaria]